MAGNNPVIPSEVESLPRACRGGPCVLPSAYKIDYASLLSAAQSESATNLSLFLQQQLPLKWRDVYAATMPRPTNIARFRLRTFEYICDLYSEMEILGEVPFDQTIEDRVIAVLGTSAREEERRDSSRIRRWVGPTDELLGAYRDKGHFMAHCIGGGLDVNLFSQERRLNRGWSPQGKTYRQMETYCYEQPGTFCFSRPIYVDGSSVPRWLEFGLLKADQTLWVEIFEN
jgi:hypothetical protein